MPLNFQTPDDSPAVEKGVLYVVATPIGHKDDITLRALRVLSGVDIVAAEDTRCAGRMLSLYRISSLLVSYHDHNETERTPELIHKLQNGASIALVSDAGTPSVSDPGYRLICAAISAAIRVIPVPGVSAATAALSISGLPTDAFVFSGFPPRRTNSRQSLLKELENEPRTLIFYESPKRVIAFLNDAVTVLGDRQGVLCREMTKRYEEFVRGQLSFILSSLSDRPEVKGECTLVISGKNRQCPDNSDATENLLAGWSDAMTEERPGDLARKLAIKYGISRKKAYQLILSEKEKDGSL